MTPSELHDYIFTDLGLCGCGEPDRVLTFLRDLLQAVDSRSETGIDSTLNHGEDALRQLVWYFLDDKELTEHGSRADLGWLTDKGHELLTALKASDIENLVEADHVEDPPARHLVAVPISFDLLTSWLRTGAEIAPSRCVDGLPEDAQFVSSLVRTEPNGDRRAYFVFEHASFPLVEAGASIAEKCPVFESEPQKLIQENLIQVASVSYPAPDLLPRVLAIEVFLGQYGTCPGRVPLTTTQARDLAAMLQSKADEIDSNLDFIRYSPTSDASEA